MTRIDPMPFAKTAVIVLGGCLLITMIQIVTAPEPPRMFQTEQQELRKLQARYNYLREGGITNGTLLYCEPAELEAGYYFKEDCK